MTVSTVRCSRCKTCGKEREREREREGRGMEGIGRRKCGPCPLAKQAVVGHARGERDSGSRCQWTVQQGDMVSRAWTDTLRCITLTDRKGREDERSGIAGMHTHRQGAHLSHRSPSTAD